MTHIVLIYFVFVVRVSIHSKHFEALASLPALASIAIKNSVYIVPRGSCHKAFDFYVRSSKQKVSFFDLLLGWKAFQPV